MPPRIQRRHDTAPSPGGLTGGGTTFQQGDFNARTGKLAGCHQTDDTRAYDIDVEHFSSNTRNKKGSRILR
jgi:hypothetical protein